MIKIYPTILILSVISMLLLNCTDEYGENDIEHSVPVSFSSTDICSVTEQSTKVSLGDIVTVEDNDSVSVIMQTVRWQEDIVPVSRTIWGNTNNTVTWAAGDQVGIYMRYSTGKFTSSNNVNYNVTTAASSSPLTPNPYRIVFPYPMATSNMKFYAYYPYAGVSSTTSPIKFANNATMDSLVMNYSLPVDQSAQTTLRNCDIMCASSTITNGLSPNVMLPFSHKMALVTIRVRTTLLAHNLSKVTLSGTAITGSGTLSLLTSSITPNTALAFAPTVTTSQTASPTINASVDIMINPCTIANNAGGDKLTVSIQFSDLTGLPRTTNLITSGSFVAGARHIYTISLVI